MKPALLILACVCTTALAQHPLPDAEVLADEVLPYPDEDTDYEALYENLLQTAAQRIDLNKADRKTLESLHLLSDTQIENFLTYRTSAGPLIDVHELQVIPGWDVQTVSRVLPFVMVRDPRQEIGKSLLQRMTGGGHTYLLMRVERSLHQREEADEYDGSPYKYTARFRSSLPKDFSIGFTAEKDAGERMSFSPDERRYGFDFVSWHAQVSEKGKIRNLIAGDFRAQFGQGLVLGEGMTMGKGGESVATLRKSNIGFLPYTGASENAGRRGIAATLTPTRHMQLSVFASQVRRDGRLSEDEEGVHVSSLVSDGYHRTTSEIAARKTVRETSAALIIDYERKALNAGLILHGIAFDLPIRPKPSAYNQFAFRGTRSAQGSVYFTRRVHNVSLFSEAAISQGGGHGLVTGILASLARPLEAGVLWRSYSRDFHSFYNNAFSENTRPVNERGLYWGWRYHWSRRLSFNGYVDLFSFPWLGFRRYAPSAGHEWMLRAQYAPGRNIVMQVQWRSETKDRNSTVSETLYQLASGTRRNLVIQADCSATRRLRLKTRVLFNTYSFDTQTTRGSALVQDLTVALPPFRITARHALFDTETYDNRHYVYENDAWLAYSFPVYDGSGVRNYIIAEAKIGRLLTVWLRYARTHTPNNRLTAAATDEIREKRQEDVKFQVRLAF